MFKPTKAKTVSEYIALIDEPRRSEIKVLHGFIRRSVPKLKPYLQSGMIGYGKFHYTYASGREGDWALIGLASQKNYISVYVCAANDRGYVAEQHKQDLPKANIGKSCIRFKKLEDVDFPMLGNILREAAGPGNRFMM